MKIAAAQTQPIKGDIPKNIAAHKKFVQIAVTNAVQLIVFPELSLTGYEPELAKSLATHQDNNRLDEIQEWSNNENITILAGLPTKKDDDVCISMIIFQPNKKRLTYSKQYLHPGEEKYFTPGTESLLLEQENNRIALAICYELSVQAHNKFAVKNNANIYIASVLNSVQGVDKDLQRLSKIAKENKMISIMSNYVGTSGGYNCAGKTSVWNVDGMLIGQLNNTDEGLLIVDTLTSEIKKEIITKNL